MSSSAWRAMLLPLAGMILLCVWVYFAVDPGQLTRLSRRSTWSIALLAVVSSFVSYGLISVALLLIGRTMGIRRVSARIFILITFLSLTLNHVVSLGVAGYSARVLLLRRAGEAPGTVLAASLLHSYLTTLVMVSLLPIGLGAIAFSPHVRPAGHAALQFATLVSTIAALGMTVALVSSTLRHGVLRLVGRIGRFLPRHAEGIAQMLVDLDAGLTTAGRFAKSRPAAALLPVLLTILDWSAVLVAFWLCLEAVGVDVGPGVLIAGFAIGINAGVVSLVPGGLGVQEGSQAGVLALFGVPFGPALLASVLFRVVYFLVPFMVSLPLYFIVLRAMVPVDEAAATES